MNEPFFPLPLPSPPEHGLGRALAGALGALRRTARALVRGFRRIDIREPLSRGDVHPRLADCGERDRIGRERPRFPVLPPVEL